MKVNILNIGKRTIMFVGGSIAPQETAFVDVKVADYLGKLFQGEIKVLRTEQEVVIEEPVAEVEVEEVMAEPVALADMKFNDLKDIAIEKGLDIAGIKKKDELIALIENN